MKWDELLRRLALNDDKTLRSAIGGAPALDAVAALDPKTAALARLAALLSVGAAPVTCRATVEVARAAGATDEEMVGVLVAVGPAVGAARIVTAAPRLALALDLQIEGLDEVWDDGG